MSVRIFNTNFLDLDLISNLSQSSQQSAFPIENALNLQRRSKVWRSNGYWDITASNNTIIFRETTAVDLTATVAEAEYTSSTALFAAIKTALEAAGASVYTVEADATTLKVKITSDGAGGGGIFEIDWTTSTMGDILGYDTAAEDTGALTYTADVLKLATSEWIQFDFGISTQPTAFCLIGARNDPIQITPSATIKIQGNETDVWNPGSVNSEITLDYDDRVIASINSTGLWSEALRYARVLIEDLDNPNGYVEIGALFLGTFFEGTRGKVQFPFRGVHVDRSNITFSEGGQTFSDIREQTERFQVRWFGLTVAEKEEIDDLFRELGTSQPFFTQFDAAQSFSSDLAKMIRYVKFENPPVYDLVSPGVYTCAMNFREEL